MAKPKKPLTVTCQCCGGEVSLEDVKTCPACDNPLCPDCFQELEDHFTGGETKEAESEESE